MTDMDIDPFKVLAAIGTLVTIGDKVYSYLKARRESAQKLLKKSKDAHAGRMLTPAGIPFLKTSLS